MDVSMWCKEPGLVTIFLPFESSQVTKSHVPMTSKGNSLYINEDRHKIAIEVRKTSSSDVFGEDPFSRRNLTRSAFPLEAAACSKVLHAMQKHSCPSLKP